MVCLQTNAAHRNMPSLFVLELTGLRAGANFSAISGSNENALKWDRGGYLAMWKQVEAEAKEAKYIAKTPSTEYFDIEPPAEKIQSMKEYLKDVGITYKSQFFRANHRSFAYFLQPSFQPVSLMELSSLHSLSTHPLISCIYKGY